MKRDSNGKANGLRQSEAKVQLQWNETSIIYTHTHTQTHTNWFLFSFIYEYLEEDNRINITAYEYVEVSRRKIHGQRKNSEKFAKMHKHSAMESVTLLQM